MKTKHRIMSLLLCGLIFIVPFLFLSFPWRGNVQKDICTHQHTEECYTTVTACRFAADSAEAAAGSLVEMGG